MPTLLLAAALATLTQPPAVADDICFDRAVVGHIVDAENFVGLDHFVQAAPNSMVLGGRWDIDIGVDQLLAGPKTPSTLKARVVLTDMFSRKVKLLIFLRKGPFEPGRDNTVQGVGWGFVPRASAEIPWRVVLIETWRGQFDAGNPNFLPRCS